MLQSQFLFPLSPRPHISRKNSSLHNPFRECELFAPTGRASPTPPLHVTRPSTLRGVHIHSQWFHWADFTACHYCMLCLYPSVTLVGVVKAVHTEQCSIHEGPHSLYVGRFRPVYCRRIVCRAEVNFLNINLAGFFNRRFRFKILHFLPISYCFFRIGRQTHGD